MKGRDYLFKLRQGILELQNLAEQRRFEQADDVTDVSIEWSVRITCLANLVVQFAQN